MRLRQSSPEAPAPPPTSEIQYLTLEQLNKLIERKAHYKISNEEWGKTLGKLYGVNTAKSLTPDQAENLLNYLETQRTPF